MLAWFDLLWLITMGARYRRFLSSSFSFTSRMCTMCLMNWIIDEYLPRLLCIDTLQKALATHLSVTGLFRQFLRFVSIIN